VDVLVGWPRKRTDPNDLTFDLDNLSYRSSGTLSYNQPGTFLDNGRVSGFIQECPGQA
jgi:hypothetical protein